jgi:hypothetical protein
LHYRSSFGRHSRIGSADPEDGGFGRQTSPGCDDSEHYRWNSVSLSGLRHYLRKTSPRLSTSREKGRGSCNAPPKSTITFERNCQLKQPNLSWFAPSQISTLDDVIRTIAPLTAAQLLWMNHDDTQRTELGNDSAMSIATGSVVKRPLTSDSRKHRAIV